jgi:hypothetical protein
MLRCLTLLFFIDTSPHYLSKGHCTHFLRPGLLQIRKWGLRCTREELVVQLPVRVNAPPSCMHSYNLRIDPVATAMQACCITMPCRFKAGRAQRTPSRQLIWQSSDALAETFQPTTR